MVDEGGGDYIISDQLQSTDQRRVTAVVRLSRAARQQEKSPAQRIDALQDHATGTQQAIESFVRGREGITIKRQFWIANAVVIEIDTEQVPLQSVARIEGVEQIHENFAVEALSGSQRGTESVDSSAHGEYTYGLEQIGVPETWEQFETQGEGVRVAVLDTGIDPDHPDLNLDGWAEFDSDGNEVDSEPYDEGDHGTHVSGTVAGGAESGTHIGVAPEIELYHGGVLTSEGGNFAAVIGGIEWTVELDAHVINMSLGTPDGGYLPSMIEPLQNAQSAGTLPISAAGNDGEGVSSSPANVYAAGMAIGASNSNEEIASFSSGEKIDTEEAWGDDAEGHWPDQYIVPDVSAPGASVDSAVPGGGYDTKWGTSMAAPHVAGVAALMISASDEDLIPGEIWDILEETAWKPDDWDEDDADDAIDGKDTRYGTGIVDAKAATDAVVPELSVAATATYDDGEMTLSIDATNTEEIVVGNLWDWGTDPLEHEADFTDNIDEDGTCLWSWEDRKGSVSTSILCTVPSSTYTGGQFGLTAAASDGTEWKEAETVFTIE